MRRRPTPRWRRTPCCSRTPPRPTSGDLDEDLLFYLKARGIPPKEAEALLIQAFVGAAVEEGIEHAGLRDALMDYVAAWLEARA